MLGVLGLINYLLSNIGLNLSMLTDWRIYYLSIALLCFLICLGLLWKRRNHIELMSPEYRAFLLVPWRLGTFLVAFLGIVFIAPYTGDPTWDYIDAAFMAILTYLTAPWCVGILYRELKLGAPSIYSYIAVCLWMFSASWSYDLYLLMRDGYYPITWWSNIFASSILYLCAGLFWSLEHRAGRGVTFNFLESVWFAAEPQSFKRLVLFALPFMTLVTVLIVGFVTDLYAG
jgi:hypothetical protein